MNEHDALDQHIVAGMAISKFKSEIVAKKIRRKLTKADTVFLFDPRTNMNLEKEEIENLDFLDQYEKTEWFLDVAKLVSGDSFGELALIHDAPRAASIQTITECFFATLSKKDFQKVLHRIELKKLQ